MKALRGATWIWWCIVMMMMLIGVMSSLAMGEVESEAGKNQNFKNIEYDLNTGKNGYTNFLRDFRNAIATTKVCEIQTLSSTPNFIYVQLKASSTKTITVALDTRDIYVLGYTDNVKVGGETRARFFKEVNEETMKKLFTGIDTKTNTKLSENYNSLVPYTRFDRDNLDLGVTTFQEVFTEVYGKSVADLEKMDAKKGQPEANFFFVMCQMIAEATRFKFMETAIISTAGTKPQSSELREFQTNWNKAAKAIHATVPTCKELKSPLTIGKNENKTVAALRDKIAVIKPKKLDTPSFPQSLQSF